jgi:hypothetical protein
MRISPSGNLLDPEKMAASTNLKPRLRGGAMGWSEVAHGGSIKSNATQLPVHFPAHCRHGIVCGHPRSFPGQKKEEKKKKRTVSAVQFFCRFLRRLYAGCLDNSDSVSVQWSRAPRGDQSHGNARARNATPYARICA